ncbi:glycosyltransferase family 39 protein [Pseudomonas sp. ZM23]|uniref:Glycosyltransferase family 39 protein n=1 Tax=Pseudomonas triclosanedens TaxID=2961893 RepID=A0ABY7A3M2_9PSED|nr:phospholipid carrier-dependent glycosyltransferase [Pseudomonas triclosanedens]MCP8465786.1 glycosyltransferase family 39 protein [Pseudomonas triclosanedens]MCP8471281.1 glycosyltransferase family 39 protein [Pseudomonas triclosanedens]MCP8477085.1 glycosyltransferase family 39 protein [Pseudomonas triclosanedens]WAI51807.1 glycosyltransferase family 39 protein [Pseudomonas triclosanedens]
MPSNRHLVMLLLLGGLLFFTALGNHELQGSTEPRVAGIAMEMYLDHDWVTPRLNGLPFLEKPPLSLWLDVTAMHLFGPTALAVRLASAFAGLLCTLLLYGALKRIGRPSALALLAAVLLMTTASFWSNARQVGEDALLALGVTLALLSFLQAWLAPPGRPAHWLAFAVGIAIATLSKGVLGLALPGVVIFACLLWDSLTHRRLAIGAWLRPLLWTLLGLVPLVVWLLFLYRAGGSAALQEILWTNSVGRFNGSFSEAGHFEPFYYYLMRLPQAFLPWNLLLYLGLWHFRKRLVRDRHLLFFCLWLAAQFTLLTLASSKRMVYLMSLAPAAAVIAAEYADVLLRGWRTSQSIAARRARAAALALAVLVPCFYLGYALLIEPRADRQESFLPLTEWIRQLEADGQQVALFQPSERLAGAGVFYSRSRLPVLETREQLLAFLSQPGRHVAVMESVETPQPPLAVLQRFRVGQRDYYFIGPSTSGN